MLIRKTMEKIEKTFIVTVTTEFPADFVPPEYFDESADSKCFNCPFYGCEDESWFTWCDFTGVIVGDEEEPDENEEKKEWHWYDVQPIKCPIKKYF